MMYVIEKRKLVVFLTITLIVLCFFTTGYAILNQRLNISGSVTLLPSAEETIISNISQAVLSNNASEVSSATKSGTSASFSVKLSKGNSKVSYTLTIKNNSNTKVRLSSIDFSSSNDAFTYKLSGIDTSTIIAIGGETTCTIDIYYNDDNKYEVPSTNTSNITLTLNFVSTSRETFKDFTGSITPDSGDIESNDNGALFSITVNNPNDFPVTYKLVGENGFVVYNSNLEIGTYYLAANSSDSFDIYINDSDNSIADGTNVSIDVLAVISDYDENIYNKIGSVTLKLKDKSKYVVIGGAGGITTDVDNISYSSSDTGSSNIYAYLDSDGKYTYFYRGKISNNYFSFAGYIWRILSIDADGNIRLILNDLIRNSSNSVVLKSFKSSNSATSLDSANTLLKLINDINDSSVNSPIYGYFGSTDITTLRGWYNVKLKDYEKYIVDSKFCMDTNGGHLISSGTSTSVFYYGPYQRIGRDAASYSPDFSCRESDIITEKIGLLSADEYVFSGGAYLDYNTEIFINDFNSSNGWWTLSPAYYDSNQSKVGAFIVMSGGYITDYPDGNTITTAAGIRPVITVNGNYIVSGEGTSSNPYQFS